jgi:predicted RNase H-like nuclease
MRVLGVDACTQGWVAIELTDGRFTDSWVAGTLAKLLASSGAEFAAVGVDMPLGLPESGFRRTDQQARQFVGPRRNSVFAIPPKAVWEPDNFDQANKVCRAITQQGLSRQAWALRPKLLDANDCRESGGYRLYEVHPEVSFREMAGAPLTDAKTTWHGQAVRRRLLASHSIQIPDQLGTAGSARPDDVLDAAAAAWSAQRIATGEAERFPPRTTDDQTDLGIHY